MAKKNDLKDVKNAAKVAKKTASTAKKGKNLCKRSGFQKALPYISILLSIILGLCFIFVKIANDDQPALVFIQQVFCGLFGGAVYFLPTVLMFTGIIWCVLHLKYKSSDGREGSDRFGEYASANKKAVTKTVLCFLELLMLSIIFGIFYNIGEGDVTFDIGDIWEASAQESIFVSGGLVGAAFAFLFGQLHNVISLVVLILLFIFTFMVIIGLTPQYIYNKIKYSREFADQIEEYNEEEDERRMEMLRAKELEKAKRRREREHLAEQRREARAYAASHDFDDEELQPVVSIPNTKTQKEPEKAPDDDVDILLGGIGITDDEDDDDDVIIPAPILTDDVGMDFGGDEVIDGAPSVDDLLDGIGEDKPEDGSIQMSQISEDELDADMQNIMPEKAVEVIQEEIALPYVFPPIDKLSINKNSADPNMQAELQENAKILKDTLKSFNVQIREINYSRGPTVTRYELKPEVGTKVKSIANLVDDIALSLATSGVRIEAPIPNKPAVGIEVPNRHPEIVYLRDLIESPKFSESKSRVTACLGKDIGGNPICFDIAKMPHLLIAGATGMGKSVCINCIIISLLYKARPEEVKLILIDPKKVEFAMYKDIPHLYAPIVSDPKKAAGALASAVVEMERRFELIENAGVRNIDGYNQSIADDPTQQKLPQIVIIIDELADLMMTAGKDVESCICRLAQKARAAGIHIIIGTQRPSVDVITGLIKANIPSRIACTVASQIDSRTILDMAGAEKLIGRGDMLFAPVGASKPMRVQGAFVSDSEVEDIVTFVKTHNSAAKYDASFISTMESSAKNMGSKKDEFSSDDSGSSSSSKTDTKFDEAVKIAIESGKISTSLLQRRLSIGFGRAGKIIDLMEEKGYVGPANGSKPREVLITMNEFLERKASGDIEEE
ncbi:MAG: DNA translocase FtsK [Ruminococcaceae bacterium]|nr:DNA translocase FtsK [Oscillospiraceae bacterium]